MDILLVDDNPGDIRLTLEAFRDAKPSIRVHVAKDGAAAMAYLKNEGLHVLAPRPNFILLDLNMPIMDGREMLALIKADASLKLIPTIILTTSEGDSDVLQSYQLQANCYLRKPLTLTVFEELAKSIDDFRLRRGCLPQLIFA